MFSKFSLCSTNMLAKMVVGTLRKYYLSARYNLQINYAIRFGIALVCIKTNVGYMVVAEFIAQSEDACPQFKVIYR